MTFKFHKQVNLFSRVMEGTFGQNLVPTGTISPNFWGALGVKPPPVMKLDSLTPRFYIQVNDKDNVDSHQP